MFYIYVCDKPYYPNFRLFLNKLSTIVEQETNNCLFNCGVWLITKNDEYRISFFADSSTTIVDDKIYLCINNYFSYIFTEDEYNYDAPSLDCHTYHLSKKALEFLLENSFK